MSTFIRVLPSSGQIPGLSFYNDDSLQPVEYRVNSPGMGGRYDPNWRNTDILWPRSSFPSQLDAGSGGNGMGGLDGAHQFWEWNWPPTGSHTRKMISGTVKDSSGNAVSGATVMLFNTATGLLVDTATSGSDGTYTVGDPNNVASFAVADKSGSPETAGTTVQTLTGT